MKLSEEGIIGPNFFFFFFFLKSGSNIMLIKNGLVTVT